MNATTFVITAVLVCTTNYRKTLTDIEILREAGILKKQGFDHVLLVGEASKKVGLDYLTNAIRLLRPHFSNISIEVQPLKQFHIRS